MESNITRRKEGCFGVKYARFLEEFYPEAWDRFRARPDHRELLRKYHAHCQYNMAILMALLQAKNGLVSRKNLSPGLQQNLYDCLVSQVKNLIFTSLLEILNESSWMR